MRDPASAAAASIVLLAIVDALVLMGAFVFTWRAARRWWRLADRARRTSLKGAVRSARWTAHRQAYHCAVDNAHYLARLSLLFCANLAGVTGLVFAAVCVTDAVHDYPPWGAFASASLLMFALFSTRSFYRTMRLARQVLRIRRDIRAASRRRRLAVLDSQRVCQPQSAAVPITGGRNARSF
jgi:hypothetical protein